MGTTFPSGMTAVVGPAVRLICAKEALAVKRRPAKASVAVFRIDLSVVDRIEILLRIRALTLIRFIDGKFTGINQHHHQHSAGKNVVGGNFALVV
jgi:hypothetical protein